MSNSDLQSTKSAGPKLVVTPAMLVIQGVILLLLSMGILWGYDHFAHTHHLHALFAALAPSTQAFEIGALLSVPFFVLFELSWVLRYKLGMRGENSENFLKKTGLLGSVTVALASGLPEEVLFRGTMQAILGVWISSALFGLMHCTGKKSIPYVLNTFIMGLTLSYVFIWSGSLWAGIIIHIANNFLCFMFANRFRALFGIKVNTDGETLAADTNS